MTVKICLAECTHDESFKGLEDSDADFEEVFQEVVKRLRHKFSSSSLVCDGNVTLVSSLKELYDKYRVQVMASKQFQIFSPDVSILSLGPGIKCVSDINKAAIRDQIQIAFTTPQESYDAYRVFQMFNSYSREELEDVFKEMQKKNLVNRKKSIENPGVQFIRALPFAAMTFQLSSVYHRFFMHGFKFVTFYRDCAHFWKQLIKGEQHNFNKPEDSDTRMEQRTASLTPGTIAFKQSRALGGHVACILSLLTTDKLSVDVSIPEEVLNCDSTELSESTELQTSEATGGSDAPLSEDNTSLGKDRVKSVRPSLAKTQTSDNAGLTEKNRVSPVQGVMSSKSSKTVESAPAVKQTASSSKAKSSEKSTKGKGLEKREIFTLKISSSSTSCSFTTPYDLTAAKDSSDYLTSYTEECEGQSTDRQSSKVSTVPVASLSFSGTSRSSRTALMLARGGKDPYTSLNQLPARAVNTHDFMTLNPCKNVLKLKKDIVANLTADNHQEDHNKAKYSSDDRPSAFATSFDKGSSDYRTYPVMISAEISIEDYIKLSREEFGFTEMDFPLTRIIHEVVEEKREIGVTMAELQTRLEENHKHELTSSQYSLAKHVEHMCKGKLLYRVGLYEECLVTASFVKPWCVTVLKPKVSKQLEGEVAKHTEDVTTAGNSLSEASVLSKHQEVIKEDPDALGDTKTNQENYVTEQTNISNPTNEQQAHDGAASEDAHLLENTGLSKEGTPETTEEREKPDKGKKYRIQNYDQYSVVSRPWITIDGDTSQRLLRRFREMVLRVILENPGISQSQIAKHFFEALRPVALQDILESLVLDECVVKHSRELPPKVSLFSTSKANESRELVTFYTPTVDCILKLATSRLTGYT